MRCNIDPRHIFVDERLTGICAFCGCAAGESFDHTPSKVLLDRPYPDDLPGVGACVPCNNSFSLDEEYVACFVDCVVSGSSDPDHVGRESVAKILRHKPALSARIESSKTSNSDGTLIWMPEAGRIRNVVVKLARGHVAFEYSESGLNEPSYVTCLPFLAMSDRQRLQFESTDGRFGGWPEIGSRAFCRDVAGEHDRFTVDGWQEIQAGRYRYRVFQDGGTMVRMILSEYLACEVAW